MINIRNFQKAQFLHKTALEQKCNKACINNSLTHDAVSFKMSYGDHSYTKAQEPPKIDGNRCIINMGRISRIEHKDAIEKNLIGKDLKLHRQSTLEVDPYGCSFKTVKVNSLDMDRGSQIKVFLSYPFEVDQKASIKDNCSITAKSVVFHDNATVGHEFVTEKIEGKGDLNIGNACKIGSIDTQGAQLTISDSAQIGNIKAKEDIEIGKNFTPARRDCNIISDQGSIIIGNDIQQLKLSEVQGLTSSNDLCNIDTIKTPKTLVFGTQTQEVINTIEAGEIIINGTATVNRVKLYDSILKSSLDSEHILTVRKDVEVPSSTEPGKSREITLENTVIKQDLIIDKNSGVTRLNLKNVTVEGAIVLENPNVEVVKDDKTQIHDIWKQED